MSIKQISVILDEQSGTLSGIAKVLADKNVEMRALTFHEAGNFKVARIIVDNILWASSALWEAGFTADTAEVTAVEIPDKEGGLAEVLRIIERSGAEIKYMYPVVARNKTLSSGGGLPVVIFKFGDDEKASDLLKAEGIKLLSQNELRNI